MKTIGGLKLSLRKIVEPQKRFTQTLWIAEYDEGKAFTQCGLSFFIEAFYLWNQMNLMYGFVRKGLDKASTHCFHRCLSPIRDAQL